MSTIKSPEVYKAAKLAKKYKTLGYHCSESTIKACSEALGIELSIPVLK